MNEEQIKLIAGLVSIIVLTIIAVLLVYAIITHTPSPAWVKQYQVACQQIGTTLSQHEETYKCVIRR